MRITLCTLMTLAAMSSDTFAVQLRGGRSTTELTEAQDSRTKELAPPRDVGMEASNADSRDLEVRPTDRKQYFVQGGDGCAGTLVAPDVVLTSASCRDKFFGPSAPKAVIVGSTRLGELTEGSERLNIVADSAVAHPDWNPQTLNANLLLFKIQPVTTNAPIALSSQKNATFEQRITTYGFGKVTFSGGFASKDVLRVDLVPAGTVEEKLGWPACTETASRGSRSAYGVSCGYAVFGLDLSDACQASVGAPVVDTSGNLHGVSSYDDTCNWIVGPYSSMTYTKVVDAFLPWLEAATCSMSDSRSYCPTTAKPSPAPVAPPSGSTLPDGTLCGLGTTCDRCTNSATYWYSKAMTACGTEPCWPYRTICGAGTTCNQCCHGYSWKAQDFFTSCD
jgi:Trypsin